MYTYPKRPAADFSQADRTSVISTEIKTQNMTSTLSILFFSPSSCYNPGMRIWGGTRRGQTPHLSLYSLPFISLPSQGPHPGLLCLRDAPTRSRVQGQCLAPAGPGMELRALSDSQMMDSQRWAVPRDPHKGPDTVHMLTQFL